MPRPLVVTVTCWVIIALSVEMLIGVLSGISGPSTDALLSSANPIDPSRAATAAYWSSFLIPSSGIALAALMLGGAHWARLAYAAVLGVIVVSAGIYLLRASIGAPVVIAVGYQIGKNVLLACLLFSAPANRYFSEQTRAA